MQAGLTVVTLECAGVLPNGESAAVVRHIELAWERGREAVEALRATLETEEVTNCVRLLMEELIYTNYTG